RWVGNHDPEGDLPVPEVALVMDREIVRGGVHRGVVDRRRNVRRKQDWAGVGDGAPDTDGGFGRGHHADVAALSLSAVTWSSRRGAGGEQLPVLSVPRVHPVVAAVYVAPRHHFVK